MLVFNFPNIYAQCIDILKGGDTFNIGKLRVKESPTIFALGTCAG